MALAFIKFFPTDYIADTRTLSTHTKGCYMDLLCLLHDNGGEVGKSLDALSRYFGCNKNSAKKALIELNEEGILEVSYNTDEMKYRLTQRRMVREEEEREYERTKKRKQRQGAPAGNWDEGDDSDGATAEERRENDGDKHRTNKGHEAEKEDTERAGHEGDKERDSSGTKPETRSQKPDTTPSPHLEGGGDEKGNLEVVTPKDWEAFCKRKKIDGVSYDQAKKLDDRTIAVLLAVCREKLTGKGAEIRSPLAVAKKRAGDSKTEISRADVRTVTAWLHPPPKISAVIDPNKPFIKTHKCHCGGELGSAYAGGSGETTYICKKCERGYPKR